MLEERRALIQHIRGREEDNNSFWPIHLQTKSPPEISPPPNVLKQEVTSVYHNVLKLNGKTVSMKCILISTAKDCFAAAFSTPVIIPLGHKPLRL